MPKPMHSAAKNTIARRMFRGGSLGRRPESFWKKTNHGNLMPAWRNTPAEAAEGRSHRSARCCSPAASEIIDFETKPDVSGNAEIERAPMKPQIAVTGMVRNGPPRSVHLRLPVM